MDILNDSYNKALADNERNLRFWENYLQNLKSLDFSHFNNKLKVPALVPIGSRLLFRGELKHTNELTVALGADYFVKCSLKQAEVLRQHRIKDAQSKLQIFHKEKEYLENHIRFTKKNVIETHGQDIIEYHTEEEDRLWREKHRNNVRQYKQNKNKQEETVKEDITDEELWNRLEELELQEELENEYYGCCLVLQDQHFTDTNKTVESFVQEDSVKVIKEKYNSEKRVMEDVYKDNINKKVTFNDSESQDQSTNLNLLQQVINRQNELEIKLTEMKNIEKNKSKTEHDLISKLDEMEKLDELEDEMDRLDDIIENEEIKEKEEPTKMQTNLLQRRVSFVDEDDSETLQLTFKHSPVESNTNKYNPVKGIQIPSDIYQAYSNLFQNETTSILKKPKYEVCNNVIDNGMNLREDNASKKAVLNNSEYEEIIVKDVIEKLHQNKKATSETKPTSLFKKKRMQNKP